MERRKISFSPPDISELEIAEVAEAMRSGWITTGPRTKLLERRLASYIETGKTDVDCTSEEAINKYRHRDAIEKLFAVSKSFLGEDVFRVHTSTSLHSKQQIIFILNF